MESDQSQLNSEATASTLLTPTQTLTLSILHDDLSVHLLAPPNTWTGSQQAEESKREKHSSDRLASKHKQTKTQSGKSECARQHHFV